MILTDERLVSPEPENWLSYRGTYNGWGYSPLDQVDVSNVENLSVAWAFSTGTGGGHESPPVVNDGVMFITTPGNQLFALDAQNGDLLWRYRHALPPGRIAFHDTNRGVALFGDKVYMATLDARVRRGRHRRAQSAGLRRSRAGGRRGRHRGPTRHRRLRQPRLQRDGEGPR